MIRFDLIVVLRIIQATLSVIALSINAAVTDWFNTHQSVGSPPGYAVFLVFASTWTILVSIPYTTFCPRYFPSYINRYFSLAFELITVIFWFSGFIAGAVYLGSIDRCAGLMCSNARAGVVFGAIIFLCFCVTSYFPIKYCFFDGENQELGGHNFRLGMNGAERITQIRLKRDAANNARLQAERDGEATSTLGRMMKSLKETVAVVKVRTGNVMGEWKVKAGRGNSAGEMSEHHGAPGAGGESMGSRQYGARSRSTSPVSGNMV